MAAVDSAREGEVGVVATYSQGVCCRTVITAIADISRASERSNGKALAARVERCGFCEGSVNIEGCERNAVGIVEVKYWFIGILRSAFCIDCTCKFAPVALKRTTHPCGIYVDGALTSQLTGIVAASVRIPGTGLSLWHNDVYVVSVSAIDTVVSL